MTTFTPQQKKAIFDQGKDILVSASAGSGKTTVLVERVLQKVLSGTPISSLLIITFTKAAASEMKERIKLQLDKKLQQDPDNNFLREQLLNVDTANISTIDAFCLDVIRRFYYVIDLDPSFSILTDETQSALLQERALTELEKKHLQDQDQDFIDFYDNFAGDREVNGAHNLIFDLYFTAMAQPNYEKFLAQIDQYYESTNEIVSSPLWQKNIKPYLLSQMADIDNELDYFLETSQFNTKEFEKVKASFAEFKTNIENLITSISGDQSYDQQKANFIACRFQGSYRKSKKWDEDFLAIYEESSNFKKETSNKLKKLFAHFYILSNSDQISLLKKAKNLVKTIGQVELEFIESLNKLKRQQNLIDYNDMEHLAFKILSQDNSKSHLARTYYQNLFSEILIDEYQDVNELQEKIVQSLKQKGKNSLFMVGDIKQSIYGFRQAKPQLFLEKYHDFQFANEEHERIILADNFRSTKNVTHTVNKLFNSILTKDFGGIDYQKEGQLIFGAKYYPDQLPTASEFIFTDKDKSQNLQEEINDDDFGEIQMVIERIRQLKKEKFEVFDVKKGIKRPLKYSDIAILSRTRSDNLQIMKEFAKADLPLFITDAQNYFQTFELIMIMNYLKIIDNPRQDIPLVAVMRSPLFNFTEPELARIRIKSRKGDFYDAVASFAVESNQLGKKCKAFLNQLDELRSFATVNRISELIWTIYEKTHLLEIVTSLPNGEQRRVNLEALYERATSYETAGFKGLYQFISFIERMRKNQKDLAQPLLSSNEDAVQLMTIHASKGLEFPVVFVVGLDHHYQKRDLSNPYSISSKLGLGLTVKQENWRADTLNKSIIDVQKQQESLEEEARILYVALTRAKQKLILCASIKNLDNNFEKWKTYLNENNILPLTKKLTANSPMQFLGPELLNKAFIEQKVSDMKLSLEQENKIYYLHFEPSKLTDHPDQERSEDKEDSRLLIKTVNKLFDFEYPFLDATKTTAYQAVSEIKTAFNDPVAGELDNSHLDASVNRYLQPIDQTPTFLKEDKFTGAQIGTATHLILQYFDYRNKDIDQSIEQEINSLIEQKKLNPEIVEHISIDAIKWFVESDFAQSFWQQPENLVREQEFSSLLSASEIFNDFSDPDAKILVHGTIDGYFIDSDGIILFDYKTDYVDKNKQELAIEKIKQKYTGQLRLYEQALNEFALKKVKSKYLVLLDAQKLVKLD
ncbi:helicase-exonuclease AddAB subunit AddA [uncultured Lactobacillus sp.]|uniref:helicase-exonuclease AddAB subunit AddA n=1 Tax=uncultured Lactobacillus sp. TaxID=153152 RepID=UPI00262D38A9|nr:helicase-exonuclease AddAB subunit AddA [uncultured Lactobacillus sp.]